MIATSASSVKHGTQQHQQQQQQQRKRQAQSKSPLLLTPPPVSPPLAAYVQQKQQEDVKIMSPTCGLQLTPSLWQTPLLLDNNPNNNSNTTTITITNSNNGNHINNNNNKITSNNNNNNNNINLSLATTPTTINCANVIINSPMHSPSVVSATLLSNITTHSAIPLPPSNFHHTTLAQHLQKVECIKKPPKRQNVNAMCISTQKAIITPPATPPTPPNTTSPILLPPLQPLQTAIEQIQQKSALTITPTTIISKDNTHCVGEEKQQQQQHSDTDLNEIPVNVIFRKPQQTSSVATTTTTTAAAAAAAAASNVDTIQELPTTTTIIKEPTEDTKLLRILPTPTATMIKPEKEEEEQQKQQQQQQQLKQQLSKPTLIMPCTKVDIEAAVSTLQNMQQNAALKEEMSSNAQQNYINMQPVAINKSIINKIPAIKQTKNNVQKIEIACNKKIRGKQTASAPIALNQNSLAADHGSAVAVIRMSDNELNADITQLSNVSVLPYCVQRHWLLCTEFPQNYVISREERIMQRKNLLQRQALQLLNTHSLQKLPLHVARKRLICVDRLLRKYDDENMHMEHLK